MGPEENHKEKIQMGNIWDAYKAAVNEEQLQKDLKAARESTFDDLPKGTYKVRFKTIEAGVTKSDRRPMLKICAQVLDGDHKKRLMFMNRVIYGTKNDGRMIASAEGWLRNLEAEDENGELIDVTFRNYSQFADLIMDIAEAVDDMKMEYEVEYDPDGFDSIKIKGVLD